MAAKGAVATGDIHTTRAAREILKAGGNAFDAALGALLAATQSEPVLASLGGGGFLLARPDGARPRLYDFFAHTPRRNGAGPAPRSNNGTGDLRPIIADFGTVQQEFHIGTGSIATPGVVKGVFAAHRELGRMDLKDIAAPALALARDGVRLSPLQAYIFSVVGPIYLSSQSAMNIYHKPGDRGVLAGGGDLVKNPAAADFIDALAREGEDLFYRGEVAEKVCADLASMGGHLRRDDFENYTVVIREPLALRYRDWQLLTNPPPSTGGILVAFALKLLEGENPGPFGSEAHLQALSRVMALTNRARSECAVGSAQGWAERLLDAGLLARYRNEVMPRPRSHRGTTHISVVDGAGNACALTVSNGEGSGYVAPGTGTMFNNMLGEEDINPNGFGNWDENTRMSSMMSPSILLGPDGDEYALGSGGSNRIRTAVLQAVLGLVDFGFSLEQTVGAPRIHLEGDLLNIEPGFSEGAIRRAGEACARSTLWQERNLFFGGVHAVGFRPGPGGGFSAAGDPRRGGSSEVL